ncbi:MAG TPA: hypothetical protein VGM34_03200, partial [Chlamydiales bacterium]
MLFWLLLFFSTAVSALELPEFADEPSNVNPVTQSYEFEVLDWVVPGIEPIEIKRSYSSSGARRKFGGWEFWPHLVFDFSSEGYKPDGIHSILERKGHFPSLSWIELMEPDGRKRKYSRVEKQTTLYQGISVYEYKIEEVYDDALEGRHNALNNRLYIEEETDWMWVVEASGNIRYYKHKNHLYQLRFEKRPNGHLVEYTYDKDNRVTSIQTKNRIGNKTYASLDCFYGNPWVGANTMTIKTSDGQELVYTYKTFTWSGDYIIWPESRHLLQTVERQGQEIEAYEYTKKNWSEGCVLASRIHADGHVYKIEYESHRVAFVKVPNPLKRNSWINLFTCTVQGIQEPSKFYPKSTEILHIGGNKIVTFFSWDGVVTAQETSQFKTLFSHDENHRLVRQELLDKTGNQVSLRTFAYDAEHNVCSEMLSAGFEYSKQYSYQQGL